MTAVIMVFHSIICLLLITVILMQSGRGGGLTEAFSSAESVFGAKTSSFMVKATTIIAGLFIVTALSLAVLSTKKDRSLMEARGNNSLPADIQSKLNQIKTEAQKSQDDIQKTVADVQKANTEAQPAIGSEAVAPQTQPAEVK